MAQWFEHQNITQFLLEGSDLVRMFVLINEAILSMQTASWPS